MAIYIYIATGSQSPDQGSNTQPLHWKLRVLTTGRADWRSSLDCIIITFTLILYMRKLRLWKVGKTKLSFVHERYHIISSLEWRACWTDLDNTSWPHNTYRVSPPGAFLFHLLVQMWGCQRLLFAQGPHGTCPQNSLCQGGISEELELSCSSRAEWIQSHLYPVLPAQSSHLQNDSLDEGSSLDLEMRESQGQKGSQGHLIEPNQIIHFPHNSSSQKFTFQRPIKFPPKFWRPKSKTVVKVIRGKT